MAKIRGVKPDFWTDEDIVELSIAARLLFIGLWTYACDNGHLQDKSRQIKMRLFAGDDVNVAELLRELEASGRIERGDGWITVPNLTEHQKIDRRFFTTCDKEGCDDPPEKVTKRESRRAPAEHPPSTPRATAERTASARGDGDGDGELMVIGDDTGKPVSKRATQLPKDFAPSDKHQALATEKGVNLDAEFEKFCDHHRAKGSTFKDWDAALRNWLRNSRGYGASAGPRLASAPDPDAWMRRTL